MKIIEIPRHRIAVDDITAELYTKMLNAMGIKKYDVQHVYIGDTSITLRHFVDFYSTRTLNVLSNYDLLDKRVSEFIMMYSVNEFKKLRNAGKKTAIELQCILIKNGYHWN